MLLLRPLLSASCCCKQCCQEQPQALHSSPGPSTCRIHSQMQLLDHRAHALHSSTGSGKANRRKWLMFPPAVYDITFFLCSSPNSHQTAWPLSINRLKRYLTIVLICIFLNICAFEHLSYMLKRHLYFLFPVNIFSVHFSTDLVFVIALQMSET